MILTVLVGNSNTRFAIFKQRRLVRVRIIPTCRLDIHLTKFRVSPKIDSAIMASVVPSLTLPLFQMLNRQVPTIMVNSQTPVPLKFKYERRLLGTDRVCVVVGGYARFRQNMIIIDFGTAITFNVVNSSGVFLGGPILPGPEIMLEGLTQRTGRLPRVSWFARARTISSSTVPAIQSGVFNLLIGGLSRIRDKIIAETRIKSPLIIGTGGAVNWFKRYLNIKVVDKNLASLGLAELYYFNRGQNE